MKSRRMRTPAIAYLAVGALLTGLSGCGGSGSSPRAASTSSTAASATLTAWASQTQQLCIQKRAAIARLGYINITYGGIARVGLPAVKRSLDRYLGRLLGVLRDFQQRQRQVPTPTTVAPTMAMAAALDRESQAATSQLRSAVAGAQNAGQLGSAFNAWTATLKRLSERGDAIAGRLNLPACRSGA